MNESKQDRIVQHFTKIVLHALYLAGPHDDNGILLRYMSYQHTGSPHQSGAQKEKDEAQHVAHPVDGRFLEIEGLEATQRPRWKPFKQVTLAPAAPVAAPKPIPVAEQKLNEFCEKLDQWEKKWAEEDRQEEARQAAERAASPHKRSADPKIKRK